MIRHHENVNLSNSGFLTSFAIVNMEAKLLADKLNVYIRMQGTEKQVTKLYDPYPLARRSGT